MSNTTRTPTDTDTEDSPDDQRSAVDPAYAFATVASGAFIADVGGRDQDLTGVVDLNADGDRDIVQLDVRGEAPDFEAGVLVGLSPAAARDLGEQLFAAADDAQNVVRADGGAIPRRFSGDCECGRRVTITLARTGQEIAAGDTERVRCAGCGTIVRVQADPPADERAVRADGGLDPSLERRAQTRVREAAQAVREHVRREGDR